MPQIRQAVERFIQQSEETGSVDIAKLQEILRATPDERSIQLIFDWLKTNRTIKILNLANVDLSAVIEPLRDLIAVRTDFTTINLTNCNLDATTIRQLCLQNCRALTALYLGWNNIGDEGAEILAAVLQDYPALTLLDLGANRIGDRRVAALGRVLQNNSTLMILVKSNVVVHLFLWLERITTPLG